MHYLWGWIDVICKALYPKHKFMGKKQQLIEIMSSFHFAFISCNCVNSSHQLDRISKPKNQNQSNHSNQSEQSTTSRGGQSVISVSKTYLWSGDLFDFNGIVHHWVGGKMFVHKVFKNHNSHVGIVQLVKKNRVLSTLVVLKRFI